jgi:hypothetical protein
VLCPSNNEIKRESANKISHLDVSEDFAECEKAETAQSETEKNLIKTFDSFFISNLMDE